MALVSEDVAVDQVDGWLALVVTGTVLHINDVRGSRILCKFNIGSTSAGFILNQGDTLKTAETIYVKAIDHSNLDDAVVIVVKD